MFVLKVRPGIKSKYLRTFKNKSWRKSVNIFAVSIAGRWWYHPSNTERREHCGASWQDESRISYGYSSQMDLHSTRLCFYFVYLRVEALIQDTKLIQKISNNAMLIHFPAWKPMHWTVALQGLPPLPMSCDWKPPSPLAQSTTEAVWPCKLWVKIPWSKRIIKLYKHFCEFDGSGISILGVQKNTHTR